MVANGTPIEYDQRPSSAILLLLLVELLAPPPMPVLPHPRRLLLP